MYIIHACMHVCMYVFYAHEIFQYINCKQFDLADRLSIRAMPKCQIHYFA